MTQSVTHISHPKSTISSEELNSTPPTTKKVAKAAAGLFLLLSGAGSLVTGAIGVKAAATVASIGGVGLGITPVGACIIGTICLLFAISFIFSAIFSNNKEEFVDKATRKEKAALELAVKNWTETSEKKAQANQQLTQTNREMTKLQKLVNQRPQTTMVVAANKYNVVEKIQTTNTKTNSQKLSEAVIAHGEVALSDAVLKNQLAKDLEAVSKARSKLEEAQARANLEFDAMTRETTLQSDAPHSSLDQELRAQLGY